MQNKRAGAINRKILVILLVLFQVVGCMFFGTPQAEAKGSLAAGDCVKNVLVYAKNSAGDEVLISQLKVSDMLDYLNSNLSTYGKVHNYSILDKLVTPVHQEAQGFTVNQMLDYAISKSTLPDIGSLGLDFSGQDKVALWEIDGNDFDSLDTYTYDNLYGITRYNFPALYGNWDYTKQAYANKDAIWASRGEEETLFSITAYSERYLVSPLYGTGNYNIENYYDSKGMLDTARSVRFMLPMTQDEFENKTSTAMNSRYGICYILFDMANKPSFTADKVAKPTYALIDGDTDTTGAYQAGYWYFTLSCATNGATIYYNDNSESSYMPTAIYTPGQAIKIPKNGTTPVNLKFRAVKEGYSDAGIQTATSDQSSHDEDTSEVVAPNASVWDGKSADTSWYVGHENDPDYTISTAAQLAGLQSLVNNAGRTGAVTFAGKTITLGNNLHLNGCTWEPIGTDMGKYSNNPTAIDNSQYYSFNGIFNGNNFTISGLAVDYEKAIAAYCGLFGKIENATIRNLTVSGKAYATGASGLGGIAGIANQSTFDNCTNKANIVDNTPSIGSIGGIVGMVNNSAVRNCADYGKVKGSGNNGGIVGSDFNCTIENCTNYGTVVNGSIYSGGIAGYVSVSPANCINYGTVSGAKTVGGIVGYGGANNCFNYCTVTGTYCGEVGGITGNSGYQTINSCLNTGIVTGGPNYSDNGNGSGCGVGGIAGFLDSTMTNCINLGTVSGYQYLGGLAGYLPNSVGVASIINNSYNHGSITAASGSTGTVYSGGIAGTVLGSNDLNYQHTISRCYDTSGGVVFGSLADTASISKVYYLTGGIEIGSNPSINRLGVDPKTTTQMKASSFVTTLGQYNANGNGTSDGYFVYSPGDYPVLYWQQEPISFALTPATAAVTVKNSSGNTVPANSDGTYSLILGATYNYEVSAEGYSSSSGSFTVTTDKSSITVALNKNVINTSGPNQIVLSWTGDPTTTQTITWCDKADAGNVQYADSSSYKDESSFDSGSQTTATSESVGYDENAKTYYQATMTGLAPGTTYYYRVGSAGAWSDVNTFTTAPASTQNFSFMYLGDVQHGTDAASEYQAWGSMLSGAYAANPNLAFGLTGGDMVESGSSMSDWNYFLSYASSVFGKIPMMTTNGNHESNFLNGKPQFYTDILALPQNGPDGFKEEFYSFDYGTVHVTVLNSWALSSEQNLDDTQKAAIANWITNDLAAASNSKFRIVVLHNDPYPTQSDTVCTAVLSNWVPLFEADHVNLVLTGHQHMYSRSYPMLAGKVDQANGITYVMGDSGQKFYTNADTTNQEKTVYSKSNYQILNISGDTLTLSAYDSDGNLLDSWSTTAEGAAATGGDVTGDGKVDLGDVDDVCNAVLNNDDYGSIMDINKDGVVDIRDAQLVLKIYLNKAA